MATNFIRPVQQRARSKVGVPINTQGLPTIYSVSFASAIATDTVTIGDSVKLYAGSTYTQKGTIVTKMSVNDTSPIYGIIMANTQQFVFANDSSPFAIMREGSITLQSGGTLPKVGDKIAFDITSGQYVTYSSAMESAGIRAIGVCIIPPDKDGIIGVTLGLGI